MSLNTGEKKTPGKKGLSPGRTDGGYGIVAWKTRKDPAVKGGRKGRSLVSFHINKKKGGQIPLSDIIWGAVGGCVLGCLEKEERRKRKHKDPVGPSRGGSRRD